MVKEYGRGNFLIQLPIFKASIGLFFMQDITQISSFNSQSGALWVQPDQYHNYFSPFCERGVLLPMASHLLQYCTSYRSCMPKRFMTMLSVSFIQLENWYQVLQHCIHYSSFQSNLCIMHTCMHTTISVNRKNFVTLKFAMGPLRLLCYDPVCRIHSKIFM